MSSPWSRTGDGTTRRSFLATGSALALGTALGASGCSRPKADKASGAITIPDAKNKLPEGDVKLRIMDSNDTKAPFWDEFVAAYEEKHPNISVTYDGLPWNRIEEVVPLGIRNGTAHDIMQLPASIPLAQAVSEGWVAPLDDVIPEFDRWQASFPEGTFAEGVQIFDGKTYLVPLASDQRHQALLHYNKQLMDDAGYDPQSKPLTWDEYRAAARKITKNGNGKAYGVVLELAQPGRLEMLVSYMAASAGAAAVNYIPHGFIDARKGEFFYTDDAVREAIEVILALKKDGSIFPGSSSLTAPEAWPRVQRGHAGMVAAGPWVSVQWDTENPEFEYGVGSHPLAERDGFPPSYPAFGTDAVVVFSKTKAKPVVGDVLSYVTSTEGQKAWGEIVGVGNPPINEEARQSIKKEVSRQGNACMEQAETLLTRPEPVVRNPEVARVAQAQKPITPNFGEVLQAIFLGKTDDVDKALRQLKDRSDRLFDKAIADARKDGAKVSREDFVFPNWDPARNYTSADYKAL